MHLCLLARYRYLLSRISYRAQQIDRQSTLKTAEKENTDCIPFTLTFHPHNHAVKSIILKKVSISPKPFRDWYCLFETSTNIIQTWQKHGQLFLVKGSFETKDQPETFKCARSRCKNCPFIHNIEKMTGPKRAIKITDHLTCTSGKSFTA